MFTGIAQGIATVGSVTDLPGLRQIMIDFPPRAVLGLIIGASVAINGTCLTVVAVDGARVTFDVMAETLRKTNLGTFKSGDRVNFERAARIGDEIGGHLVSGHVHTTATVKEIHRTENNCHIVLTVEGEWQRYLFAKGFVCLNGASLTIGEVKGHEFDVWLIPETLRVTTFGSAKAGDVINLEIDNHAQTIVDTLDRMGLGHLLTASQSG